MSERRVFHERHRATGTAFLILVLTCAAGAAAVDTKRGELGRMYEEARRLARAPESPGLMDRVHSLTLAEVIDFRLCRASARIQGYEDDDFPGFVTMVPMADAEIVRLQQEGYAYLR